MTVILKQLAREVVVVKDRSRPIIQIKDVRPTVIMIKAQGPVGPSPSDEDVDYLMYYNLAKS